MKFTEEKLEQAVIDLFEAEGYKHLTGEQIHKEMPDVLLRDDLKQYLLNRYSNEDITLNEIEVIIRKLDLCPASALYESNKEIIKLLADGFLLKREDRSKKDLYIQLIDYGNLPAFREPGSDEVPTIVAEEQAEYNTSRNIYKIVNQLEIQGYEKRIPDAIIYINGIPLVVIEFKSAIRENTTIKNAYDQITIRYRRDIPELLKYNAFCVISDGVNNRAGKEAGLVVDYIGIKSNMNVALKKYSNVEEDDFEDISRAVVIVKDQLDLLAKLFHKFNSDDYFNGTALKQLECLNMAAEFVLLTADIERRFMGMVKKLRSAYKICTSSDEVSQKERDHIHFYSAIAAIVHKLTKGNAQDTAQMNKRVREMIKEALLSDGVEEVFKLGEDEADKDIDIFSDEYMAKIDKIKLPNTKIKLLQQLLKKAIDEFKKINKIKGIDFTGKFKKLLEKYNERKEDVAFANDVLDDIAGQFADLFKDLQKEKSSFEEMGIDFEEKAFYDILKAVAEKHDFIYPHEKLITLSQAVKKVVDDKAKYTDWSQRDDIKAELKVDLILVLAEHGYPPVPKDEVFKEIFEQTENFKKYRTE